MIVLTEGCPLPLPGVRVRATAPGRADVEQTTSADGRAVLTLAPGAWLLTATLEGLPPSSVRVEAGRGSDQPVRLLLATASEGTMEIAPHGPCLVCACCSETTRRWSQQSPRPLRQSLPLQGTRVDREQGGETPRRTDLRRLFPAMRS
ncbi:MAG TPA: carboxypeptidase-like regulatory domain-containing protein [Thermoanaerobaculia bacterium]|nr:carboxypeptidase-like regulatory domain-containing protein [Thermoanaerobaculia bacterium]